MPTEPPPSPDLPEVQNLPTPLPDLSPPKRGRGRPKGSKTRPKWLRDALKKAPKNKGGRPRKDAPKKPTNVEELLAFVQHPNKPKVHFPNDPNRRWRAGKRVQKESELVNNSFTKLKKENPEKLREIIASGRAKRNKGNFKKPGSPKGMTNVEYAVVLENARKITRDIMARLEIENALPENPIARKAMENAIQLLAQDLSVKDRLSAIRTLLEYNLAKPASTTNVNVKTAEDYLDAIAVDVTPAPKLASPKSLPDPEG